MKYNLIDTLRIDTATIQQFNDDKAFHYTAENAQKNTSFDVVFDNLGEIFDNFFDALVPREEIRDIFIYFFGIILIAIICIAIYRKFPYLFALNKKVKVDDALKEENIQTTNFANEIKLARQNNDLNRLTLLIYLQTVFILSKEQRILWLPNKTVKQYTYEVKMSEFNYMTSQFMKIRYGKYNADESTCNEMEKYQSIILKG